MIKKISVLGSTGSIGTQTLEIARYNQDIGITALAAGSNVELLEKQVREFHPKIACLWKEEAARELKRRIRDLDVKVVSGMEGLIVGIQVLRLEYYDRYPPYHSGHGGGKGYCPGK